MKKTDYTPYQRLANAIIEQACLDYLEAKHKLHTTNYKSKAHQTKKLNQYKKWLIEVPYFFKSEYFKSITETDGERLLNMMEKKYILEVIESALKVSNYCASTSCDDCIFAKKRGKYYTCVIADTAPENDIPELNTIYKEVKKNGKANTNDVQE